MIYRKLKRCVLFSILTSTLGLQLNWAETALFYLQPQGGYWQIWQADLAGRNPRKLTDTAWDKRSLRPMLGQAKVLTRDNQGVLFALDLTTTNVARMPVADLEVIKDYDYDPTNGFLISTYAENALDNLRIWQIPQTGKPPRLVIPDKYLNEMPRWIPGSQRFVFVKTHEGKSGLFCADLGGAPAQPFLKYDWMSQADPAPSPDGKRIAFCRNEGSGGALCTAEESGSNPKLVYKGKGLVTEPCWSLDGVWLYFSTWDESCFRVARIRGDGSDFAYITQAGFNSRNPICMSWDANP